MIEALEDQKAAGYEQRHINKVFLGESKRDTRYMLKAL